MYRAERIKEKFINVLGWRQHFNTDEFQIKDELSKSETGQYFQDMHPLITLENIKSIAPDFQQKEFEFWKDIVSYKKWQIVKLEDGKFDSDFSDDFQKDGITNSYLFRAMEDNQDKNPILNPDIWKPLDLFSDWLQIKTEASILKAIESYYSVQLADKTVKNLLESKVLFEGAGRMTDVVRPTNSLAGFEIIPIRAEGVTLKIEKIGLQFNQNGNFTLYLMHSSSSEPIKTIEVEYTKNGGIQWLEQADLYLPYMSENTDAGGSWFLCYNQKELPEGMKAIEKNRDWSKEPCRSCSNSDYVSWQAWSKYLEIHPFKVPAPEEVKMWDISDNLYTYTSNYGLNLKVTMECDLTDIIVEQRKSFQNVIGLQVAADMIREFAYNPNFRINRMQQNFSRNELLYELDGDSQGYKKSGILYRLEKAMEALRIDTTGINRVCMPCKSEGIRYRTT